MNTDQKNVLVKVFHTLLFICVSTFLLGCSIPERRRVIERIVRTDDSNRRLIPRHVRYEQCVAKMVSLDLFKADDIEKLCNQAHGRRE